MCADITSVSAGLGDGVYYVASNLGLRTTCDYLHPRPATPCIDIVPHWLANLANGDDVWTTYHSYTSFRRFQLS